MTLFIKWQHIFNLNHIWNDARLTHRTSRHQFLPHGLSLSEAISLIHSTVCIMYIHGCATHCEIPFGLSLSPLYSIWMVSSIFVKLSLPLPLARSPSLARSHSTHYEIHRLYSVHFYTLPLHEFVVVVVAVSISSLWSTRGALRCSLCSRLVYFQLNFALTLSNVKYINFP